SVLRDPVIVDQGGAEERFDEGVGEREDGAAPNRMPLGMDPERPEDQHEDKTDQDPTGSAVAPFGQRFRPGSGMCQIRDHLPITVGTMTTAAIAGNARPDEGAARDDRQDVGKQPPGVVMKPYSRHQRMRSHLAVPLPSPGLR